MCICVIVHCLDFFFPVPIWKGAALDGIREACRLSREILDKAHEIVQPGVMTDEIDEVVCVQWVGGFMSSGFLCPEPVICCLY